METEITIATIGPVVGVHAGPGALGPGSPSASLRPCG